MKIEVILPLLVMVAACQANAEPEVRIRLTKKGVYPDDRPPLEKKPPYRQAPTHVKFSRPQIVRYKRPPQSLDGWLTEPKKPSTQDRKIDNVQGDKPGLCGHYLGYGIQCGTTVNQCHQDQDCPGITKCCSVSDCGLLCVKPKAKSKMRRLLKQKPLVTEEKISATTAEGLKIEDIAVMQKESSDDLRN